MSLCVFFKSYHLFQTQFKQVLRNSDGTEGKWLLSCHCSELFSEIISVSKFANLASFTKATITGEADLLSEEFLYNLDQKISL